MDQYAEARSGVSFDPDVWSTALAQLDYHLAMLVHFMGTWENSGSFVYNTHCWSDQEARVKAALVAFGCEKTANLFRAAAELDRQIELHLESEDNASPELEARREQMNETANEDVSYEKLATFIREHHTEFLR